MISNYLKTTLRSFKKNKLFVSINTIGLGLAIACAITAYLNYDFSTNKDENQPYLNEIYRLNSQRIFNDKVTNYGIAPTPLSPIVQENMSGVKAVSRYNPEYINLKVGDDFFSTRVAMVDPQFTELFEFDYLFGSPSVIKKKEDIIITDLLAEKFYGKLDAVGEQLSAVVNDRTLNFTVAAVVKDPGMQSSFFFESIINIENFFDYIGQEQKQNWDVWSTIFLHIPDASNIDALVSQLQPYIANQNAVREDLKFTSYYLDPFKDISPRSERDQINSHWLRGTPGDAASIAPLVMAGALLLIACFNFTNTSIAISSKRLKEIGIRKVLGSYRKQLITQFMTENIVLCLLGLLIGIGFAAFLVPAYSDMWGFLDIHLDFISNPELIIFLFGLLIFTALVAGSYPAIYISSFKPTAILKGNSKFNGTNNFTRSLLFFQFFFCLLSILTGFAFLDNAEYQRNMDYGYTTENIVFHYLRNRDEVKLMEDKMSEQTGVEKIVATQSHLFSSRRNDPVKVASEERDVEIMDVSHDYMDIMDLTLLKGRGFRENSASDQNESIIINETFIKEFNLENPIGTRVVWLDSMQYYVVGIVKDFYNNSIWSPIEPLMLRLAPEDTWNYIIVQSEPGKIEQVEASLKMAYNELYPSRIYNGRFMDESIRESIEINGNVVIIFLFLAIIALSLTCIGLFSLVSLNIIKRTKEIGIRKVLGASVPHIVNKLNKEFIIILSLSSIVAVPLGIYVTKLLFSLIFYYYLSPQWSTVLICIAIIFLVSGLTLGGKVIKAARANPVKSLKTD